MHLQGRFVLATLFLGASTIATTAAVAAEPERRELYGADSGNGDSENHKFTFQRKNSDGGGSSRIKVQKETRTGGGGGGKAPDGLMGKKPAPGGKGSGYGGKKKKKKTRPLQRDKAPKVIANAADSIEKRSDSNGDEWKTSPPSTSPTKSPVWSGDEWQTAPLVHVPQSKTYVASLGAYGSYTMTVYDNDTMDYKVDLKSVNSLYTIGNARKYHLHSGLVGGDNKFAAANPLTGAEECGGTHTFGHYDPFAACGGASTAQYAAPMGTSCTNKEDYCTKKSDSVLKLGQSVGACEVGDLNGRFGFLPPNDDIVVESESGVACPGCYNDYVGAKGTPSYKTWGSIVFHNGGPRVLCGDLIEVIAPTSSPTKSPVWSGDEWQTAPPTSSPTKSPVWKDDGWDTAPPTSSPTKSPGWKDDGWATAPPTSSPTKSPVWADDGWSAPAKPKPTDSPTLSPTLSPSLSPSKSPSKVWKDDGWATSPPTDSPVESWSGDEWSGDDHTPTMSPTRNKCKQAERDTCCNQPDGRSLEKQSFICDVLGCNLKKCGKSETPEDDGEDDSEPEVRVGDLWSGDDHTPTMSPTRNKCKQSERDACCDQPEDRPLATQSAVCDVLGCNLKKCGKRNDVIDEEEEAGDEWGTSPPTKAPTESPVWSGDEWASTSEPTKKPSKSPTKSPRWKPSYRPTKRPSKSPTKKPSWKPSASPTKRPTKRPSKSPSRKPSKSPTRKPTWKPSWKPTAKPSSSPSWSPSWSPSASPSSSPTEWGGDEWAGTAPPTEKPTTSPVESSGDEWKGDEHEDVSDGTTRCTGDERETCCSLPDKLSFSEKKEICSYLGCNIKKQCSTDDDGDDGDDVDPGYGKPVYTPEPTKKPTYRPTKMPSGGGYGYIPVSTPDPTKKPTGGGYSSKPNFENGGNGDMGGHFRQEVTNKCNETITGGVCTKICTKTTIIYEVENIIDEHAKITEGDCDDGDGATEGDSITLNKKQLRKQGMQ